ncbi:MAG TPA: type II toxin-antitoxin system prevent-host-death family antitoxin [Acidimicrobiales bacterium]|nr:type II toxin-antitoxin system prevent-host-death family antitoxin [Acidimicrobiales bacterium]
MSTVGIRALKQNASQVVARVAAGEVVTITDRGRPVAQLVPVRQGRVAALVAAGRARPAKGSLASLGAPREAPPGKPMLSEVVAAMRGQERY